MSLDANRTFSPVSTSWKIKTCEQLSLNYVGEHQSRALQDLKENDLALGKPLETYQTRGDGNCFFRALAFVISGDEDNHINVREHITRFIAETKNESADGICRFDPEKYLQSSGMRNLGTWATDIEILFAASFLQVSVFVYSQHGDKYDWLEFKPSTLRLKNDRTTRRCIYLQHTNLNHYDVVTSVQPNRKTDEKETSMDQDSIHISDDEEELNVGTSDEGSSELSRTFENMSFSCSGLEAFSSLTDQDESSTELQSLLRVANNEGKCISKQNFDACDDSFVIKYKELHEKIANSMGQTDIVDPYEFCSDDSMSLVDGTSDNNRSLKITPLLTSTPKKTSNFVARINLSGTSIDVDVSEARESCFNQSSSVDSDVENLRFTNVSLKTSTENESLLLQKAINTIPNGLRRAKYCKDYCLQGVDKEEMKRARIKFWSKSYENRVNWFIDKIGEGVMKNGTLKYVVEGGRKICGFCLKCLFRIDKNFYYSNIKRCRQGIQGSAFRKGRGAGRPTENALTWLENYAYYHAEKMPTNGDFLLPYKTRKIDIYHKYTDDMTENLDRSVSQSRFYDLWKTKFKRLKIKQTNSFSKCCTCVHLERKLEQTRDSSKRAHLKRLISVHNERQMTERRYYYKKRNRARVEPKKYMSIIIDGMDQAKTNLPHFTGRMLKGVDPNSFLKTHIQGVINHGNGKFDTFIDINEYCHDSNLVMNILLQSIYDSFLRHGSLPDILYIQADNCARENKNKFVLAFCELLVRLSVFKEVHLSFLQVGHTHEDIDAAFSRISERLRKTDAETLPRLQSVIGGAKRLQGLFDIKAWLAPCINSIEFHSKPLHFKFCKDNSSRAIVKYRSLSTKPWLQGDESILHKVPVGKPSVLVPPNFHKVDEILIKGNVVKHQFNLSQEQTQWWQDFLNELKRLKESPVERQAYANRSTGWILPLLKGVQEKKNQEESERVEEYLLEMVDKELDDHKVIIKKSDRKKRSKDRGKPLSKVETKKKMLKDRPLKKRK